MTRVYIDIVGDLFHIGHINLFKKVQGDSSKISKTNCSFSMKNIKRLFYDFLNSKAQIRHIYGEKGVGKTNFV